MGSDGRQMPLHWFEKKPGRKGVDQDHYLEVMETVVLPWIQATYGDRDVAWCFQQVRQTTNMNQVNFIISICLIF